MKGKQMVMWVIIFCTLLTACTSAETVEPLMVEQKPIEQNQVSFEETGELVIARENGATGDDAIIDLFRREHPEITVRTVYWSEIAGQDSIPQNWTESGAVIEFPDVIQLRDQNTITYTQGGKQDNIIGDVYQLMDSGVLLDLTELVEQDETLDLSAYDSAAMAAGIYRGGRYFLPVSYQGTVGSMVLSMGEQLDQWGFNRESLENMNLLLPELGRVRKETGIEQPLVCASYYLEEDQWRAHLLQASGVVLIDRESGIILPEVEKFREFCDSWKSFFYDGEMLKPLAVDDNLMQAKRIYDAAAILELTEISSAFDYLAVGARGEMVLEPLYGVDGRIHGEIQDGFAICTYGKNQKNAWTFLKFMLSQQVQNSGQISGLPVMKDSQQRCLEEIVTQGGRLAQYFHEKEPVPLSTEQVRELLEKATAVNDCGFISMPVYRAFEKEMSPYFSGQQNFETCAKALQQALKSYLGAEE